MNSVDRPYAKQVLKLHLCLTRQASITLYFAHAYSHIRIAPAPRERENQPSPLPHTPNFSTPCCGPFLEALRSLLGPARRMKAWVAMALGCRRFVLMFFYVFIDFFEARSISCRRVQVYVFLSSTASQMQNKSICPGNAQNASTAMREFIMPRPTFNKCSNPAVFFSCRLGQRNQS